MSRWGSHIEIDLCDLVMCKTDYESCVIWDGCFQFM